MIQSFYLLPSFKNIFVSHKIFLMVCLALQCLLSMTSFNPSIQANHTITCAIYSIANLDYHYSCISVDLTSKYVYMYTCIHILNGICSTVTWPLVKLSTLKSIVSIYIYYVEYTLFLSNYFSSIKYLISH